MFTNWVHGEDILSFSLKSDEVKTNMFLETGEWEILSMEAWKESFSFGRKTLPLVGFTIKMKRNPLNYLLTNDKAFTRPAQVTNVLFNKSIDVSFEFYLSGIEKLDETNSQLVTYGVILNVRNLGHIPESQLIYFK